MKFSLYVDEDGTTTGYCNDACLQRYNEGKGAERPTSPSDLDVYCVGCGKALAAARK